VEAFRGADLARLGEVLSMATQQGRETRQGKFILNRIFERKKKAQDAQSARAPMAREGL
jgi:hypothetical protein